MAAPNAADRRANLHPCNDAISAAEIAQHPAPAMCSPGPRPALDLSQVDQMEGDDWQRAAFSVAEGLQCDGYLLVQLNDADAAAVEVLYAAATQRPCRQPCQVGPSVT